MEKPSTGLTPPEAVSSTIRVSVAPGRLRGGLLSGRSMAVQRHPELFAQEERQITYMACVFVTT